MKFDKAEKIGAKKEGSKKKLILSITLGLLALSVILLPILLGGLK